MLRAGLLTLNTVLLVACGYVVATSARTLLRPTDTPAFELSRPRSDAETTRSFERYAAVASRDLFQPQPIAQSAQPDAPPPPDPEEELAESKLRIRLIGTAAATDPAFSLAAVEDLSNNEKLVVRPDEELAGARVVRIERKRLVIENRGRLEAVTLDEEDEGKTPPRPSLSGRQRREQSRPETSSMADRVRELQRQAAAGPKPPRSRVQSVLTQARIVPRYGEDGQLAGLELTAIKPESLLETAGFENGDRVVSVNGTRVSDPAQGLKSFRGLSDKRGFVVEVERDGSVVELEYVPEE
jgi:general secretion pathway protein C